MNFFPVRDLRESQSEDGSSDAGELSSQGTTDGLRSLEEESSQERTSLWVQSDSGHAVDGDSVAEELVSQLTNDMEAPHDEAEALSEHSSPDSRNGIIPPSASSPILTEKTQTVPVNDSDTFQTAGH